MAKFDFTRHRSVEPADWKTIVGVRSIAAASAEAYDLFRDYRWIAGGLIALFEVEKLIPGFTKTCEGKSTITNTNLRHVHLVNSNGDSNIDSDKPSALGWKTEFNCDGPGCMTGIAVADKLGMLMTRPVYESLHFQRGTDAGLALSLTVLGRKIPRDEFYVHTVSHAVKFGNALKKQILAGGYDPLAALKEADDFIGGRPKYLRDVEYPFPPPAEKADQASGFRRVRDNVIHLVTRPRNNCG